MPQTNENTSIDQETINQEAIYHIETRLAFQEDLLDALNKLITDQQKQIEQLWQANRLLKQQMEKMHFETNSADDNQPPPHY
jgi:SlyX protein